MIKGCDICGSDFETVQSEGILICSFECQEELESRRESENQDYRHCERCGELFFYYSCQNPNRRFCSRSCYKVGTTKNISHTLCENCGERFSYRPPHSGKFCSNECFTDWYSGERCHFYIDGDSLREFGRNWKEQRQKTLERDNSKCRICGDEQNPQVHHIIPRRKFRENEQKTVEESNKLSNLITLCPKHHGKVEQGLISCPEPNNPNEVMTL